MVCLLEHTSGIKFHLQHVPHLITGLDNHEYIVYGDRGGTPGDQAIEFKS